MVSKLDETKTGNVTPKIIRKPLVYIVGRQEVDRGEIDRFLGDHGMDWETDTEIGGEQLVEAGGRLCYVSYGKGRKTNAEYVRQHHRVEARVGAGARGVELHHRRRVAVASRTS